ncbi:MAG: DoxX family protein [Planktotalea sp.]|uniref:DoxX family protein n=1 Tax=Planktotalea sp. TaxID=2029877 RepID=UPI003C77EFE8
MRSLIALQDRLLAPIGAGDAALAFAARFAFAAALAIYFFNSGLTKLGDGLFGIFQPSLGAYAQIFPRAMEAAGYDVSQLGLFHWAVVTGGTVAEFVLPALIIVGLFTRFAALGMIGFITVQSLTDLIGHGAWGDPKVLGAWFDRVPDGVILDQRMFWVLALAILVFKGAGWLSLDRVLARSAD